MIDSYKVEMAAEIHKEHGKATCALDDGLVQEYERSPAWWFQWDREGMHQTADGECFIP